MKATLKLLGVIAILAFTCLGLLSVFEIIPYETLSASVGKVVLGLGVLGLGAAALSLLGGGTRKSSNGSGTEPPPVL
jgi:hypothetical protein